MRESSLRNWLFHSDMVAAKGIRFGLVGAASGVIFALVTSLFASGFGWDGKAASVIGYVASIPLNFLGNRSFSFRSTGNLRAELLRFVLVHGFNIMVTVSALGAAVDILGLHYLFGVVFAIVLVPGATFLAMNFWVFARKDKSDAE